MSKECEFLENISSYVKGKWEKFEWGPFFRKASLLSMNEDEFLRDVFLEKKAELVGFGEAHSDVGRHKYFSNLDFIRYGVKAIALELESEFNKNLGLYLQTGKEDYLNPILDWERKMIKKGYVVWQGRYQTEDYLNIVRHAKRDRLEVRAIDVSKKERLFGEPNPSQREKTMIKNIVAVPKPAVLYIGQLHLFRSNTSSQYMMTERIEKLLLQQFFTVYFLNIQNLMGVVEESFANFLSKERIPIPFILDLKEFAEFFPPFPNPGFIGGKFDFLLVI